MDKAKVMRLAWRLFKHYSNHKTHTFSHCLKESWAVLNKGRKALQTAKATMQVINGESFPIIRGNEPLYSWEMNLKNLKPVDLQRNERLSLDDGMAMARSIQATKKLSDGRGYKNSSIYNDYHGTYSSKGVRTYINRLNTQTVLRKAEGKVTYRRFAKKFGEFATYSQ